MIIRNYYESAGRMEPAHGGQGEVRNVFLNKPGCSHALDNPSGQALKFFVFEVDKVGGEAHAN